MGDRVFEGTHMRKSFFVLAAMLVCPAVASANWLWTSLPTNPTLVVQLNGQFVRTGAWTSKFYYNGNAPTTVPGTAPAGWNYQAITYCSSPNDINTNPDCYDINGPASFGVGFGGYTTLIKNQLSHLVNRAESALGAVFGASVLEVRGAIQAAVWKVLGSTITESVAGFYGNAKMFNTYMHVMYGLNGISSVQGFVPAYLTTDKFAEGLGPVGQNQNMIWTINGPNGGLEPFPVPLPATAYGALALVAVALAGRRLFGIAA